jgi:hypothetical protein
MSDALSRIPTDDEPFDCATTPTSVTMKPMQAVKVRFAMTTAPLQRAIEVAQLLRPREKYQLIEAVAHSLAQADVLEMRSASFIRGRRRDDLIAEQQPPVVTNRDALAADFWPEDVSADDINDYIEAQRRLDREPSR